MTNGAFLLAGLVDEFNLVFCPVIDGAKDAPAVFDSTDAEAEQRAPVTAVRPPPQSARRARPPLPARPR